MVFNKNCKLTYMPSFLEDLDFINNSMINFAGSEDALYVMSLIKKNSKFKKSILWRHKI